MALVEHRTPSLWQKYKVVPTTPRPLGSLSPRKSATGPTPTPRRSISGTALASKQFAARASMTGSVRGSAAFSASMTSLGKQPHDQLSQMAQDYEVCMEKVREEQDRCKIEAYAKQERIKQHGDKVMARLQQYIGGIVTEIETETSKTIQDLENLHETLMLELANLKNNATTKPTTLSGSYDMSLTSSQAQDRDKTLYQQLGPVHDLPKLDLDVHLVDDNSLTQENMIGFVFCRARTEPLTWECTTGRLPCSTHEQSLTKERLIGTVQCKTFGNPLWDSMGIPKTVSVVSGPGGMLVARKMVQFHVPFPPLGLACTKEDNIIVCQNGDNRVQVYHPDGHRVTRLPTPHGTRPTDVEAVGNTILMADLKSKAVIEFDCDASQTRTIFTGFKGNAGICVYNNKMFVTSPWDNKVFELDYPSAHFKQVFAHKTAEVDLYRPWFVAADPYSVAVSCRGNNKMLVFDREGDLKFEYCGEGSSLDDGLGTPWGVVIDSSGRFLISDGTNHCIHIVSKHGNFLGLIDLEKDGLYGPVGLALSRKGHLVLAITHSQALVIYDYKFK